MLFRMPQMCRAFAAPCTPDASFCHSCGSLCGLRCCTMTFHATLCDARGPRRDGADHRNRSIECCTWICGCPCGCNAVASGGVVCVAIGDGERWRHAVWRLSHGTCFVLKNLVQIFLRIPVIIIFIIQLDGTTSAIGDFICVAEFR